MVWFIGTFGRVKLVQSKKSGSVYALKIMYKSHIIKSHQQRNIMNEKNIMAECKHPFLLQLFRTFQDENRIYMLLELVQGGELWSLLYKNIRLIGRSKLGGFNATASLFYAGCVTSALQYLHLHEIAYRDLKPENLLLDNLGYLKVVDFGFAKKIPYYKDKELKARSYTLCGTPEYLAPELVVNAGHTQAVDCWALGILIYELILGDIYI